MKLALYAIVATFVISASTFASNHCGSGDASDTNRTSTKVEKADSGEKKDLTKSD